MSSIQPIENIPCVNPTVTISNIRKSNGSCSGNLDVVAPKVDGPFNIEVYAKTDDVEKPSLITVTISYDPATDQERTSFYGNPTILRTITYVPPARTTTFIYPVSWDGRDGQDCRILLGGEYIVTATARFTQKVSWSSKIRIARPNYVNLGIDYPGTAQDEINKYTGNLNMYEFSKVPYLRENPHADFEWIRQLSILSNNVNAGGFNKIIEGGAVTIDQARLDRISQNAAWLGYLGHAGFQTIIPAGGYLYFNGNNFYSTCTDLYYGAACDGGHLCMDLDCNGNQIDLDDVMLVVLNACRTNLGTPSFTARVIENGADCVISTKTKLLTMMENFWYQRFTERLFVSRETIAEAASDAFDDAITDIAKFLVPLNDNATVTDVQKFYGTYVEDGVTYYKVNSYLDSYVITDNLIKTSTQKMVPARYGIRNN